MSCNIRQSLPGGADRDSATIPSLNFSIPARIIADLITYIHARYGARAIRPAEHGAYMVVAGMTGY